MKFIVSNNIVNINSEVLEEDLKDSWVDGYGVRYSSDKQKLLQGNIELEEYTIIESTKVICDTAFENCSKLMSISIPHGVTSIGIGAFRNCKRLTSLLLPSTTINISEEAFAGCSILFSINFPQNVICLFDNVIKDCDNLKIVYVPLGCNSNYARIFPEIKDKLVERKHEDLYQTQVTNNDLINATIDEHGVKYSNDGLRLLEAPHDIDNYIIKEGTKVICDAAFLGCHRLQTITFPASITTIGSAVFSHSQIFLFAIYIDSEKSDLYKKYLPEMEELFLSKDFSLNTIPDDIDFIESIIDEYGVCYSKDGKKLLKATNNITHYSLPLGTRIICDNAFAACKSLKSVYIPKTIMSIGHNAFSDCKLMERLYIECSPTVAKSILIDYKKLESIWISEFYYCEYMKIIPNDKIVTTTSSYKYENDDTEYFDGQTAIYHDYGKVLTHVSQDVQSYTVLEGTRLICENAFGDYWEREHDGTIIVPNIKSVTFPKSLRVIENAAFDMCEIKNLFITSNIESIGERAFFRSGIESIIVDTNNKTYDSRNNCNAIIRTKDNALVLGCKNTIIPNTVQIISSNAFNGAHLSNSICIPEGVLKIEDCAFCNTNLSSLTLPNSIVEIEDNAFYECQNLTSIYIPDNVKLIGNKSFDSRFLNSIHVSPRNKEYYSENESNAIIRKKDHALILGCCNTIIPNTVKIIKNSAFYFCKIKSLKIPSSVVTIENSAFYGCSIECFYVPKGKKDFFYQALKDFVVLEDNNYICIDNVYYSLDKKTILYCPNFVENFDFPKEVRYIGDKAFHNSKISSLIIPESIIGIGHEAFSECKSLNIIWNTHACIWDDIFKNSNIQVEYNQKKYTGSKFIKITLDN